MNRSTNTASILNNAAVRLLIDGSIDGAFARLQEAMRILQASSWEDTRSLTSPTGNVESVPLYSIRFEPQVSGMSFFPDIYNHAFVLAPMPSADDALDEPTVVAVVLYNLGLILHSKGLDQPKERLIDSTLNMYMLAKQIVDVEAGHSENQNPNRGFTLLSLALGNNIASIHSSRMDYHKASLAVQWMRDLTMSVDHHEDIGTFYVALLSHELFGWPTFSSPAA